MTNWFPQACRLCVNITKRLTTIKENGETFELACKIKKYLHIEIKELDGTCFQICRRCQGKVEKWHTFFQHVSNARTHYDPLNTAVFKYLVQCSFESHTEKKYGLRSNAVDDQEEMSCNARQGEFEEQSLTYEESPEESIKANADNASFDKDNDQETPNAKPLSSTNDQAEETNHLLQCDESQTDNKVTKKNRRGKKKPMPPKWKCQVCSRKLPSWTAFSKHCRQKHDTSPEYQCLCGKILTSRGSISTHYKKHEKGLMFKCDSCGKTYHRKQLLRTHLLSHLPKEEQPWICDTCQRRFYSKHLLRQHKHIHLPTEEKFIFPCELCSKKFSSKSAAAAHTRHVHLQEKLFVCERCGLQFARKGILDNHLITGHSNVFNYQCQDCGKNFKTKPRLKIHADTHRKTRYECPVCKLSLNTRRTLRMHLLVHEEKKRLSCDTCGKGFKRPKDLKNHKNLHTGLRPYVCQFCGRTFTNGPNCRSHKLRKHREELKKVENPSSSDLPNSQVLQNPSDAPPAESNAAPGIKITVEELQTIMSNEAILDCFTLQYPLNV